MATNYLILWLALGGAVLAVVGFIWTVRSGQMDDLDTPPHRVLFDDTPSPPTDASTSASSSPPPPATKP
ncbi:MAG: cbb3-type cytochrome oxidase assembly protein CcoS [Myxococcales bacterium]|nr:cbb3-type cytochrome oxidase assembly protein CcoS [Myxococcales bacterium]